MGIIKGVKRIGKVAAKGVVYSAKGYNKVAKSVMAEYKKQQDPEYMKSQIEKIRLQRKLELEREKLRNLKLKRRSSLFGTYGRDIQKERKSVRKKKKKYVRKKKGYKRNVPRTISIRLV